MPLLVYLPLLIPALAAAAARPLAARLEPRRATWLLTLATVVLAVCSMAALSSQVAARGSSRAATGRAATAASAGMSSGR
ncbi:MAG TPA: hypothetical protein VG123_30930 [Streptosporangiaceae bacterium]|nr:hypothetical protein [Streptosporangiaceae bacterium]